jgi:LysR family nitrogen assimilation transcriptional regulator
MAKSAQSLRGRTASPEARNVIDSRRLLYFYHVGRMRSFSVAASFLGIAQPALSRQIQQLESDLGVQLLARNGRGVSLTESGTILHKQALAILGEMSSTLEQLQVARHNPTGQISIAAPAGIMSLFMPDIVRRFIASFPEIRLTAIQAATGEVYDHLASGAVDVAIIMHPRSAQKMFCQRLAVEPLRVVVRRQHPIAKQEVIERDQLKSLKFVLPASRHGMREYIERYCEEGGIELDCNLYIDSVPLMKALVLDLNVCAFLPKQNCDTDLDASSFVALPLKPILTRTVYVASLESRSKSPFVKALIREVISVFKEKSAAA